MINNIERITQQKEQRTSFLWNFSTTSSPWMTRSPIIVLDDKRECSLTIEGTFTNKCVSRLQYNVKLSLTFSDNHASYINEEFRVYISIDKKEYKLKLVQTKDRQFSDEVLIHPRGSLSCNRNLQLDVELICRTVYVKDYRRLPFDNNITGLSLDLQRLLKKGELSDLEIVVKDRVFHTHRTILSCRSNVFARMIETDMMERRNGRIILDHWDPDTVESVLIYIYTGKYKLSQCCVHEIFELAHYLELDDLQSQCKLYLLSNLTVENIAATLRLSQHDQYDMAEVEEAAKRFVEENEIQCTKSPHFDESISQSITMNNLDYVLRLANNYALKKSLEAAMEFIKKNYERVMKDQRINSYLVSEPHLFCDMLGPSKHDGGNSVLEEFLGKQR